MLWDVVGRVRGQRRKPGLVTRVCSVPYLKIRGNASVNDWGSSRRFVQGVFFLGDSM